MTTTLTALQIATRQHAAADMLRAGFYAENSNGEFHGCSVGCLAHEIGAHESDHAAVAEHYGYPAWLAHLQDRVFEGLPKDDRAGWHVSLADAIAARGRDWPIVMHAVHAAILRISYRTAGSAAEVVQAVIELHEAAVRGEPQDDAAWSAAESAAWSAAESAAWSVARSAAWSAARSAAWSAAESAAWSAAESAAWSVAYREIADATLAEIQRPA